MTRVRRSLAARAGTAALVAWLAAGAARAEVTGQIEPTYTHTETETTDQAGLTTRSTVDAFVQRYRLGLDRRITPVLRFDAGAIFDDSRGWTLQDGVDSYGRTTTSALRANLQWGTNELGGGAGYDRRRFGGYGAPVRISETVRGTLGWEIEGGHRFALNLSRTDRHDEARAAEDLETLEASFTGRFRPSEAFDLQYSMRYTNPVDAVASTEIHDLNQNGRIAYSTTFLERRGTVSASYALNARQTRTFFAGAGGELATALTPLAGLSAIEAFPATADRIPLAPNGGIVDGETAGGGAGAAVNIGYAPSVAGRREPRHVGVDLGLGPAREVVNTLYVHVDQPLPPELAGAFPWTVWRSEDNLVWIPVALTRPPVFDPFLNRFELRFVETTARYVKAVTVPLLAGATLDQRFANVFVTEVQPARVEAVPVGRRTANSVAGSANLATAFRIARPLSYDASLFTAHREDPLDPTWYVVNGLSYLERLGPKVGLSARVQRSDSDRGAGHESQTTLSTGVNAELLPTLRVGAAYSGQISSFAEGRSYTNSVSALGSAELYEGVSLAANAAYTLGRIGDQRTAATTANTSLALQPHRRFSGTLGYGVVVNRTGAFAPPALHRLDAGASWNPIGSVYANGTVGRTFGRELPNTAASVGLSWSPLAESALRLSLAYGQTIDTLSESTARTFSSGVRWTIRPRAFLDVSYVKSRTDSLVQDGSGDVFNVGLVVGI